MLLKVSRAGWLALCGIFIFDQTAFATTNRSPAARAEFMRMNPCPANGQRRGKCPGYVVDHVKALCAGGEDNYRNMQWQTVADGKKKDVDERQGCRKGQPVLEQAAAQD